MKKLIALTLALAMMGSVVACSDNDNRRESRRDRDDDDEKIEETTERYSAENYDGGADPQDEAEESSEDIDNESDGTYTYVVDGHEITLSTNIDEYISINDIGNGLVRLNDLAASIGMEYWGHMGDGSATPMNDQCRYFWDNNGDNTISMDDICVGFWFTGSGANQIYFEDPVSGNNIYVEFDRNDVDNPSVTTYYIYNDPNESATKNINYEQIVIFTYLLENAYNAPAEDWMETAGFSRSGSNYHVNS